MPAPCPLAPSLPAASPCPASHSRMTLPPTSPTPAPASLTPACKGRRDIRPPLPLPAIHRLPDAPSSLPSVEPSATPFSGLPSAEPSASSTSSPLVVPFSDGSNLPPYKLIVTYGARSFKNYKGDLSTVSSWSWHIHVQRQTSYDQLVGLFQNKYPWGKDEGVVISKWNSCKKYFLLVRSDEDVISMYDENKEDKIIKILVQFCKNGEEEEFAQSLLQPISTSPAKQKPKPIVEDLTQNSQYEYEIPEENLAMQQRSKEGYVGEDHVGIDEEVQYLDGSEQDNGCEQANHVDKKATEDGSQDVEEDSDDKEEDSDDKEEDSDEEDCDEGVVSDEDSDGGIVHDIPKINYDKDNPPMTKWALFPSIEEFRVALAQHAIVNEFSYKTDKSDQKRVRVSCSYEPPEGEKSCKWRVHGSTLYDDKTVQAKKQEKKKCRATRHRRY